MYSEYSVDDCFQINTARQYHGAGGKMWLEIEQKVPLNHMYSSSSISKLIIALTRLLPDRYTVASLGPGSGRKELEIINLIRSAGSKVPSRVTLIDASSELLAVASRLIATEVPEAVIENEKYNFTKATDHVAIKSKLASAHLITCFGNTIGGDHESNIIEFLDRKSSNDSAVLLEFRNLDANVRDMRIDLLSSKNVEHELAGADPIPGMTVSTSLLFHPGESRCVGTATTSLNNETKDANGSCTVLSHIHFYDTNKMHEFLDKSHGLRLQSSAECSG